MRVTAQGLDMFLCMYDSSRGLWWGIVDWWIGLWLMDEVVYIPFSVLFFSDSRL